MTEDIFDAISSQIDTSGASVSRKLDGTIVVSLPDSEETLAICTDNGDGTLSYTMKLGDGGERAGKCTPEAFREHVLDALDSWIDYVPYDEASVEPQVSPEYRKSIGESRESGIRSSLYEMGLDDDQADAIMEAVGILYESSMLSVNIDGKTISAPSITELATSRANKNYVKRRWLVNQAMKTGQYEKYKANEFDENGDRRSTDALIQILGLQPPNNNALIDFVKEHLDTLQKEHVYTDDEVLGVDWYKSGVGGSDRSGKTGKNSRGSDDDAIAATMGNETPIESDESDESDNEIATTEVHHDANEETAPVSEEEASKKYGIELSNKKSDDVSGEVTIETLWDGDVTTLGKVNAFGTRMGEGDSGESVLDQGDSDSEFDIPVNAVGKVVTQYNEFKSSLGDILKSIPAFGSQPTGFALQMIFGRPGSGIRGAVLDLFKSNQNALHKIERGEGILDASKATPDQRTKLEKALHTEVVRSAIKRVQDGFDELAALIEGIIPNAYDEARGIKPGSEGSVNGHIDEVPPDFVNLFRTILHEKGVPFAGYPWSVVDKMCTKLGSILKLGKPVAGGRRVTGAPVDTKVSAA
jgi:hypothetical protein